MSPRRNRPPRRRHPAPVPAPPIEWEEDWGDDRWRVRPVSGPGATKPYRCPGCDQEIRPGVPHLVVWPLAGLGGLAERRHWHAPCWRARDRRRPTWR